MNKQWVLVTILVSQLAYSSDSTLTGLAYDFYSTQITRNKYNQLFTFTDQTPYRQSKITATANTDNLFKNCEDNPFDFVHTIGKIGLELIQHCPYRAVLQSVEYPGIYTLTDLSDKPMDNIQTIGVAKNSPASQFITPQMTQLGEQWQVVEFDSGASMVSALLSKKIDALVGINGFIASVNPKFSDKIAMVYSFNIETTTLVLIPVNLNQEKSHFIIKSFTDNQDIIYINQLTPYKPVIKQP